MVTQMAKYLDTVYVSGWQASSTASSTDEPGPDLADYPYVSYPYNYPVEDASTSVQDNCTKQGWPSVHGTAFP